MSEDDQGQISIFSFGDGNVSFKKICKFDLLVVCNKGQSNKNLESISVETDADGAKIVMIAIDGMEVVVGEDAFSV